MTICFRPGEIFYGEMQGIYYLAPGIPLRDVSCFACGKPAGGQPVQLSFFSSLHECQQSYLHAPATMLLRHLTCPNPDDSRIRAAIITAVQDCYDKPATVTLTSCTDC